MEKLIVNISASKDHYGAFCENVDGIYAAGNTVAECKRDLSEAIQLAIKYNGQGMNRVPDWVVRGDYEVEYHYDTQSLLDDYNGIISKTALAQMTGIHVKQLQHYASGLSKPRAPQRKKIASAFHKIGREMAAVCL